VIILDFNQVALANLMVSGGKNIEVNENLLRHMILNSIRMNKKKFEGEFGELIIACDAKNNWRKQYFPYYKANRKRNRDASPLDWNEVFRVLNMVRDELKEYFPYATIQIEGAEADDVIASICHEHGRELGGEPILILSGDKDFQQLQKYVNVQQYDPVRKRWLKCREPRFFLIEHILKGDASDGVPNVLSEDDTFVSDSRQKPMRQKFIDAVLSADWPEDCTLFDDTTKRNYERNRMLIDLDCVPHEIHLATQAQLEDQSGKGRDRLFNYFIKHKLKNLTEYITEF
jgi:hypothetical protein